MTAARIAALFLLVLSIPHGDASPPPGRFLIASPASTDPEFAQTVILLLHSGEDGAIGIIVNRRTAVPLPNLFPELGKNGAPIFNGGPMRMGINALLRSRTRPPHAATVVPGVYVIADQPTVKKMAAQNGPSVFRVYVGLCGWSAGQLKTELRSGLWLVSPAGASAIFDDHPESLWRRLMAKLQPNRGGTR